MLIRNSFKKQGGLPSFKKRIKYKSSTLKGSVDYKLKDNVISLNGYEYKFSKSQKILADDKIKTITIKRDNLGFFYICVSLETKDKAHITTGKSVGFNFGLKTFLALSDNTVINSLPIYVKSLKVLKSKQRKLSSKKKNSNNRAKAKLELANNLAFNEFIGILTTKTNVVEIDKFYPSSKTCSCCGYIKNGLNLKDRVFDCPNCKAKLDRDYNASLNIYRIGVSTLSGEFVRPTKVG